MNTPRMTSFKQFTPNPAGAISGWNLQLEDQGPYFWIKFKAYWITWTSSAEGEKRKLKKEELAALVPLSMFLFSFILLFLRLSYVSYIITANEFFFIKRNPHRWLILSILHEILNFQQNRSNFGTKNSKVGIRIGCFIKSKYFGNFD